MRRVFPWLAAGLFLSATPASADEILVDGIAAQVGEDVVLVSEVMAMVAEGEKQMRAAGVAEDQIAKLRAQGLERLIEDKLIHGEVKRMELYASDDEIDETIGMIASDNGITAQELEKSVRAQNLDFEDYREQIKQKIENQRVIQVALLPKVEVEESAIRRLYDQRFKDQPDGGEQIHLRHLLVPASQDKDLDTACVEVTAADERIAAGEAFEAVAAEISVIAPEQGGDIGWVHASSLASWMAKLVATLEPGGISPVNRQPFGCNLLKLVEKRAFERVSYEMAEQQLFREVQQMAIEAEFVTWMEELRERTFIQRYGYFAAAAQLDTTTTDSADAAQGALFQ
ncbi:MAG: SurA N-terminal domain-containing protein [Deltaproteobacteria bacterium]|nr:SurA N-terminal domain-containing protein [Deltaproteobacteria bacterium]MBW2692789.1 SurA N-terminal domain-containing protein [Deltaproteobacteria bacterium]